jgi:hypothetical protein
MTRCADGRTVTVLPEVAMTILDRFPIRHRGTGVVVAIDHRRPVVGDHLRRTTDGHVWRIEAVEAGRAIGEALALCIVGDPPSIGDDVVFC